MTDDQELLDQVAYLWEAAGPGGQSKGYEAALLLLKRWDVIPEKPDGRVEEHREPFQVVATVAMEAQERDLNVTNLRAETAELER